MNRRVFVTGLGAVLTAPLPSKGEQAGQSKVGLLFLGTAGNDWAEGSAVALREGLRELGWIENQNIHFQYRFASGQRERLDQLAGELVKDKMDVIVGVGTEATRAARRATSSIPIVMAGVGDPVRAGFVTTLSRPGGNTTGVSLLNQELWPKRLELIKEVVQGAMRVAVVSTPDPQHAESLKLLLGPARRLGLQLRNVLRSRSCLHRNRPRSCRCDPRPTQPRPRRDAWPASRNLPQSIACRRCSPGDNTLRRGVS